MKDYKTFGFTDEQVMIRDNVLGLLQKVLPQSTIAELDAAQADPTEAFQALAADGWLALPFEAPMPPIRIWRYLSRLWAIGTMASAPPT
jgi:alkylation response protein AidB-like acyl-CoA dehydrogenase